MIQCQIFYSEAMQLVVTGELLTYITEFKGALLLASIPVVWEPLFWKNLRYATTKKY